MLNHITTYYKILDQEERKGNLKFNEEKGVNVSYGEEVRSKSRELKAKREELRTLKKDKSLSKKSVSYQRKTEEFNLEIQQIKDDLTELKRRETDVIAKNIESGKAVITLKESQARGKNVYTYGDLTTLLTCKIVMSELRKQYHVYPSNRNEIVDTLEVHLRAKIQYGIIRSDIKHFFESIPQDRLMKRLYEDGKVSPRIMRYIKRTLYAHNVMTHNAERKGLPRGVCFSSYLAEIYLRSFDESVKNMDGVLFYRRYVDDILILTIKPATPQDINRKIEDAINSIGLELHHGKKTMVAEIYEDSGKCVFDYLGYKFNVSYGHTTVGLSTNKIQKYNLLLNKIFEIYGKTKNYYAKKNSPLKEFLSRIAVLMGNGNLNGRKNFVKTGIYYSNKMLTSLTDLEHLDKTFKALLNDRNKFSIPRALFANDKDYEQEMADFVKNILNKYGFKSGFVTRKSYNHSDFTSIQEDLKHIYLKYSGD